MLFNIVCEQTIPRRKQYYDLVIEMSSEIGLKC